MASISLFLELPIQLVILVLECLDLRDLVNVPRTCKPLYTLSMPIIRKHDEAMDYHSLWSACYHRNVVMLKSTLRHRPSVANHRFIDDHYSNRGYVIYSRGMLPLGLSIRRGFLKGVSTLLTCKADVQESDLENSASPLLQPLAHAIIVPDSWPAKYEIVKLLVDHGAPVNPPTERHWKWPFPMTSIFELVQIQPRTKDLPPPRHNGPSAASEYNDSLRKMFGLRAALLRMLLQRGVNVNLAPAGSGVSLLMMLFLELADFYPHYHFNARYMSLIDRQNQADAVRDHVYRLLRIFVGRRVDLNYSHHVSFNDEWQPLDPRGTNDSKRGCTALHLACRAHEYFHDIVKELVRLGADIHIQDEMGQTPLFYYLSAGEVEVPNFHWMVQQGADIHHRDHEGNTLLHIVCMRKGPLSVWRFNMAQHLIRSGVKAHLLNSQGQTAADKVNENIEPELADLVRTTAKIYARQEVQREQARARGAIRAALQASGRGQAGVPGRSGLGPSGDGGVRGGRGDRGGSARRVDGGHSTGRGQRGDRGNSIYRGQGRHTRGGGGTRGGSNLGAGRGGISDEGHGGEGGGSRGGGRGSSSGSGNTGYSGNRGGRGGRGDNAWRGRGRSGRRGRGEGRGSNV